MRCLGKHQIGLYIGNGFLYIGDNPDPYKSNYLVYIYKVVSYIWALFPYIRYFPIYEIVWYIRDSLVYSKSSGIYEIVSYI